ncbi:MAG: homoserine dehydrogenase [Rhodospirillales bacterium]|tara:strand:- start:2312 stop:3733 length:1422 start_codon:yes stop_codon:yes gene_type:complete
MVDFNEIYKDMGAPVRVGLVGAGEFGASLITQSLGHPAIDVPVVADIDPDRAVNVLLRCGVAGDGIEICRDTASARDAMTAGKVAVVPDGLLLVDTDIDLVVEATGAPEAAAAVSEAAILAGKHLVLASKEMASVCGPWLARLAADRGVVYTLPDGDQPSLLIGLVSRAELLGLEVVMAGKASEYDVVWHRAKGELSYHGETFAVPDFADNWHLDGADIPEVLADRAAPLGPTALKSVPDLCEMMLVCNATGLRPDFDAFHAPLARTVELPDVFRPETEGGILMEAGGGVVDIVNCLRRFDELSLAGGVFVIVRCADKETWQVIKAKGIPVSSCGNYGLLHNPVHLLGIEAAASIIAAAKGGMPTSGRTPRPAFDLVGRATRAFKAGEVLDMGGHHHTIAGLEPLVRPAQAAIPGGPLPYYMAANNRLVADIRPGETLTVEMVEAPQDSALWRLRGDQDRAFPISPGSGAGSG